MLAAFPREGGARRESAHTRQPHGGQAVMGHCDLVVLKAPLWMPPEGRGKK